MRSGSIHARAVARNGHGEQQPPTSREIRISNVNEATSFWSLVPEPSWSLDAAGFSSEGGSILRTESRALGFECARNSLDSVRFEDRGQRHLYAFRCSTQLGPQKLTVANADGFGLLRD